MYAYGDVKLLKNVTITVGLSVDYLSGDLEREDQVNPKFGVTWNPLPGTTVRAAVFRVLKRTLITDQTLEPTQVAGFNQFFDDPNRTEAWRYGVAVDQRFTETIFGGVELSKRDLTVPFLGLADPANPVVTDGDWEEWLARVYLFWAPHPWVALRTGYVFERFEREAGSAGGFTDLDTHRVPVGISFFHPSGIGASFTATYWNQEGTFERGVQEHFLQSGQDDFWLLDAAISYRLPKRWGFITVGVTNLLDTNFKYYDVDFDNPTIQPVRAVFARFTLAFP